MSKDHQAVVAQFYRAPGGKLEMFWLTALERQVGHDGREYFSLRTYDVDLSKRYGYIFHMSGFGGDDVVVDGPYFCSGDGLPVRERPSRLCSWPRRDDGQRTRAMRRRNRTQRLVALPRYFDLEPGQDLLDWLEQNGIDGPSVYCSECRDWVLGDELCEHCWWCEKTSWYSTPGERCGCADLVACRDEG